MRSKRLWRTALSLAAAAAVAAALSWLPGLADAYVDCNQWYGQWSNSKPTDPGVQLHDKYWITFGPAGDVSPVEVKSAYRDWTHCGPAIPDVVSRCDVDKHICMAGHARIHANSFLDPR